MPKVRLWYNLELIQLCKQAALQTATKEQAAMEAKLQEPCQLLKQSQQELSESTADNSRLRNELAEIMRQAADSSSKVIQAPKAGSL